ncbi:hypothetical protein U1Q18_052692 [Sarracenia purpurea var. burkii]
MMRPMSLMISDLDDPAYVPTFIVLIISSGCLSTRYSDECI